MGCEVLFLSLHLRIKLKFISALYFLIELFMFLLPPPTDAAASSCSLWTSFLWLPIDDDVGTAS